MKNFNEVVSETVKRYDMLSEGDRVLVGLSGGPDSVCLLRFLVSFSQKYGITVFAAHVNHNLRGAESDKDEAFCRSLCEKLNVPLSVFSADVAARMRNTGEGTEEAARALRLSFLKETAKRLGCNKIALGHNADDLAETMLFNIARGSGIKGLAAMKPVRNGTIRPLIAVPKNEISAYLDTIGEEYVTDSTNLGDEYTRNRLRHNIIPELKKLNPSFLAAAARLASSADEDEEYLESLADKYDTDFASEIAALPLPISKRLLVKRVSKSCGFVPDSAMLLRLIGVCCGKAHSAELFCGYRAAVENGKLVLFRESVTKPFCIPLSEGENLLPDGRSVFVRKVENNVNVYNSMMNFIIESDKITGVLCVRTRREGDRIRLRGVNRSLKRIMVDSKIPARLRGSVFLVADDARVWYAERIGTSDLAGRS